jgi:hypothetical protein
LKGSSDLERQKGASDMQAAADVSVAVRSLDASSCTRQGTLEQARRTVHVYADELDVPAAPPQPPRTFSMLRHIIRLASDC